MSLDQFVFVLFDFVVSDLVSSVYQAKRLTGKNVFDEMTDIWC